MSRTHKDRTLSTRSYYFDWTGEWITYDHRQFRNARLSHSCSLWWRAERRRVRTLLRDHIEPFPSLHRNSAHWDYF